MKNRIVVRWLAAWLICLGALAAPWATAQDDGLGQHTTVDFAETPLRDILTFFSDNYGVNFAYSGRMLKEPLTITAKMKKVPVNSALRAIAAAAGLECEFIDGNVIVLTPKPKAGPGGRRQKPPPPPRDGPIFVNTFEQGLEGWFAPRAQFGGIKIDGEAGRTERAEHVKNGKSALEWRYAYGANRVSAIMRRARFDVAVTEISFWLNSQNAPITLMVGLKERDGSEYNAVVQVGTAGAWALHRLSPTEFDLDDDGEDENDALDLDQVREFSLVDVTGMFQQGAGENTVWLDDITVN